MVSGIEQRLVAAAEAGDVLDLRTADDRVVGADTLRDLLLGRLRCDPDPRGLLLRGVRLEGVLDLDGVRAPIRLRLRECDFPHGISLRGASLPLLDLGGSTVAGLLADDAHVENTVLLWRGFTATGLVSLVGARIGGKLDLSGALLNGGAGAALAANQLTVGGDLLLDRVVATGADPAGTLQLTGARVAGRLSARGLHADSSAGIAVSAANLQVSDMVDLSDEVVVRGRGDNGALRLVGARLGSLSLGRAELTNPAGWALAAHYIDVAGTLYLDGVRVTGGVRLSGGRLGGQLELLRARVDGGPRPAVAATRLQVAQALLLQDARLTSASRAATADFRSARIAGDVDLRSASLHNTGVGAALRMSGVTVGGVLAAGGLIVPAGEVNLRDAAVGALYDLPAELGDDVRLRLDRLTYRGLPGDGERLPPIEDRLRWLRRMPEYAAQPYRQLAAAYQAAGHEDEARRLLIAQQQHLAESGALGGWSRVRHRVLGLTLGYGYQTWRAVVGLLGTILLAVALFLGLAAGTARVAGGPCPSVDRIGLAIDTAVPLVQTGAGDRCDLATTTASGRFLAAAGWGITLLGWGFASLVVAGYTGLVRRT